MGRLVTVQLLQHPLDSARAAAAGHGDVELVVVFGHLVVLSSVVRYVVIVESEREGVGE